MKKIYALVLGLALSGTLVAQNVLYSNDFEAGLGDATVVGSGALVDDAAPGFGKVFHNAVDGQAIRTNYLQLPNNIFADLQAAESNELTVSFWVNEGTAVDYTFTPLFAAYGAEPIDNANTWPMFIVQSRLLAQLNVGGYTDFTDDENVAGDNLESVEWLADGEWHFYAFTLTPSSAKVYVDGVLKNEWVFAGEVGSYAAGLFANGAELDYICLGGNQAWDFGDVDAAYKFDDVAIYSEVLTVEEQNAIIAAKSTTSIAAPVAADKGELVSESYFTITGAPTDSDFNALTPGIYVKRTIYSSGLVESTKVVKGSR